MNLLEETERMLAKYNKSWDDVRWIGVAEEEIPIDVFKKLANRRYDNGFGINEVRLDLVAVGSNWWFERDEYDGSEWWEFKTMPKRPQYCSSDATPWRTE